MRGLAEYVMIGRRQAILAVLLCGLLPLFNFLSAAIVALVCLRKGWQEAVIILAWAILPATGWALIGDMSPLILLIAAIGLAMALRTTESWQFVLLASIVVALGTELSLRVFPESLNAVVLQLETTLSGLNLTQEQGFSEEVFRQTVIFLYGFGHMVMSIALLILARRWQALLYNPGGFQQEFHRIRLENKVAFILVALFILAINGVPVLQAWAYYFIVPLMLSGLALVHGVVKIKKLPQAMLVVFYFLLLLPSMLLVLVLLALIDSWYDIRKRLQAPV